MTTLVTLPQTLVPIGPGQIVSPAIDPSVTEYIMHIQQIGWPHADDKAFDFFADIAVDGVNFEPVCSGDVYDSTVPSRNGSALDSFNISCGPLPGRGTVGRVLRFRWIMAKPLLISGTLQAT